MSVIEFKGNDVYYKKLYEIRKQKGDLFGVITSLKSLERSGSKDFFLYYELSLTYLKMELYTQSIDNAFKCFNYCSQEEKGVLYGLLSAIYYKICNDELAGYYLQLFIKSKSVVDDEFLYQIINEYIEKVTSIENNFYIAYPYDKADFTKYLENTEEIFKRGEYEKVISMLEIIPKNSSFYVEALLKKSVCNFLLDNVEDAIKDMEIAVSIDDNDVYVLCNLISMLYDDNKKDVAKPYIKKLDSLDISEEDELYKVVMVNAEIGRHKKVISYGEKYLKIKPYDKSVLHMTGIAYYNLLDFDNAYKKFKKVFNLTGTFTSSTYLAVCENAINYKKEREYLKLNYIFDLPKNTRKIITKKLNEIVADKTFKLTEENAKEFFSLMDYCFEGDNYHIQASALTLLSKITSLVVDEYLKTLLLRNNVYDRIKQGIIGHLLDADYIDEIPVMLGGVYKKVTLFRPYFKNQDKESVFFTAYVYAFAKLVFFEKDLKKLCQTCEDLYEKAKENDVLITNKDAKELGAVIYELSNYRKIQKRREFAKFFNVNLKKVKEIKLLFDYE